MSIRKLLEQISFGFYKEKPLSSFYGKENSRRLETKKIKIGNQSKIYPPRRLNGVQHIQIGDRTIIHQGSWLGAYDFYANQHYTPKLLIGNDVSVGEFACFTCVDYIIIGDGCLISEFVYISDHFHGFDPQGGLIVNQPLVSKGGVRIGNNTFIGYRASILPGVHLGKHCVVGINSVVTKSFPDYSMVAGIPARLIKRYSFEQRNWITVTI